MIEINGKKIKGIGGLPLMPFLIPLFLIGFVKGKIHYLIKNIKEVYLIIKKCQK